MSENTAITHYQIVDGIATITMTSKPINALDLTMRRTLTEHLQSADGDDHVKAINLIFHKGQIGETYNIGGSNELKNIDLIHELINITDSLLDRPKGTSLKLINYVLDRPGHDLRYAIDSSKIYNKLGWKASENFKENIEKTVSWYIKKFN